MMLNTVPEWLKPYAPATKLEEPTSAPIPESNPAGGLKPKHTIVFAEPKELKPVEEIRGKHFAEIVPENTPATGMFSEVLTELSSSTSSPARDQALDLLGDINDVYEDTEAWVSILDESEILVEWARNNRRIQFDFVVGEEPTIEFVTFTSENTPFSIDDFPFEKAYSKEFINRATEFLFQEDEELETDDLFDGLTLDL